MADQSAARRRAKLDKLIDIEGFESEEMLFAAVIADSVSPAICMNDSCDYTVEMEPDQDRGYCEVCGTNSMTVGPHPRGAHLTSTPVEVEGANHNTRVAVLPPWSLGPPRPARDLPRGFRWTFPDHRSMAAVIIAEQSAFTAGAAP